MGNSVRTVSVCMKRASVSIMKYVGQKSGQMCKLKASNLHVSTG